MASALISADVLQIVQRVPELKQLAGKRLFITGGTGFVGCWLLETLVHLNETLETPCQVWILTRSPEHFQVRAPHLAHHKAFHFVAGDVTSFDYSDIPEIQYVIHAAAPADPVQLRNDPLSLVRTIVTGSERLLEWAATQPLDSFLFVSSGAVYGAQPTDLDFVAETFTGAPTLGSSRAIYGEAKRMAESLCVLYQERHSLPLRIARLFSFIGPYQDLNAGYAVTDFIREGLAGKPLHIASDGTTQRSYAYAADMAYWLWAILLRADTGTIYNVGSDRALSIRDLAEHIAAGLARRGQSIEIEVAQQPIMGRQSARYIPETRKARTELDVDLFTDLADAIDKTLAWFDR